MGVTFASDHSHPESDCTGTWEAVECGGQVYLFRYGSAHSQQRFLQGAGTRSSTGCLGREGGSLRKQSGTSSGWMDIHASMFKFQRREEHSRFLLLLCFVLFGTVLNSVLKKGA